ncbi:sodium/glutamate symporter [Basilea psittacipulmonis]|uniref:Sodium/glutamate symporter n=1 Tax=Basilea psittacipulmonis DSM 24701 TaxID=1072685 RepID=A0A077DGV0_9BURK|nr:sodium/glutamate symporter [Basilea psittacipulmonis]AIL33361.1 sodium:glutamate symporter [Basilea psittacipulmonis DSM 24701]
MEFNAYYTLIFATIVLLFGRFLVKKIKFLQDFNIPEPVAGGLVAAILLLIWHSVQGTSFTFDGNLQRTFMLMFFASIGLSADFSRLRMGGKPLIIFLFVVGAFIIVQNVVGVSMAMLLGLDHSVIGLITGSVTLTGGHGTAGAWGGVFEAKYGLTSAKAIGIASATFGLVLGGLIGGPVARRLINKVRTPGLNTIDDGSQDLEFERPKHQRYITSSAAIETLAMFAACLVSAEILTAATKGTWIELPQFVWALASGVVIRNFLVLVFKANMFDRAIDVFGNASLSLFLAMALLTLRLWELADLAAPILIILAVQTIVMILYAYFVTFRVMGSNYDAAVLAAGHCGFGMGATPTAIANMQAITDKFGPSHKAFLIVPMVGAFFIDIINAAILQLFNSLPFIN